MLIDLKFVLHGLLMCMLFNTVVCIPSFDSLLKSLWFKDNSGPLPWSDSTNENSESSSRQKRSFNQPADSSSLHYEVLTTR